MSASTVELHARDAGTRPSFQPRAAVVDLSILWFAFGAAVLLTFASTVDDPFIPLRYAHNIATGHGAVFNPGERVNGATSPEGLALAIIATVLPGGFTMVKLKLLSVLFGGLTVGWSKKLVDGLALPALCRRGALLLIGASPIVGFAAASGLETTLEGFALVGLVVELRSGRAFVSPWRAGFFAALCSASRPEGLLLVGGVAAVACLVERPLGYWTRIRWAMPAVVAAAAILTADRVYYGSALPNTYYAKHVPFHQAVSGGLTYLVHGWDLGFTGKPVARLLLWVALTNIADAFLLAGLVLMCARFKELGYLGAACLAEFLFVLGSGGDWIQGSRFMSPVVPFLVVLTISAIAAATNVRRSRSAAVLLLAVFGVTTLFPYLPAASSRSGPVWALGGSSDHQMVASGGYVFSKLWADSPRLLSCVPKGGLVAVTEAGYVGFARPDLRILDLRGLVSRDVAAAALPSTRRYFGIQDPNWASEVSPIGRILIADRPAAILTVDPTIGPPLNGRYKVLSVDSVREATMTLYGLVGGPCDQPVSR